MTSLGNVIFLSLFILGPAFCQPTTDQECRKECGEKWGSIVREDPYKNVPIKTGRMEKGADGRPECKCIYSAALYFVVRKGHDLKEFQKEEQDFGKAILWLRQNGFKLEEDTACDEQCKKNEGSIVERDPPRRVPKKGGRMEVNKDGELKCKCTYSEEFYGVLERAGKNVTAFKECENDDQAARKWLNANGFTRQVIFRDTKTPSELPTTAGKEVKSEGPEVGEGVQSKGKEVKNEENPMSAEERQKIKERNVKICHEQCRKLMGSVDCEDGIIRPITLGILKSYEGTDGKGILKCHCGLNSQVIEILRQKGFDIYKIRKAYPNGYMEELRRQGLNVYVVDEASASGYKLWEPPTGQPSSSGNPSSSRRHKSSGSNESSPKLETIQEETEGETLSPDEKTEKQPPSPGKKTEKQPPSPLQVKRPEDPPPLSGKQS